MNRCMRSWAKQQANKFTFATLRSVLRDVAAGRRGARARARQLACKLEFWERRDRRLQRLMAKGLR